MSRSVPLPPLTAADIQRLVFHVYTTWIIIWLVVGCIRALFSMRVPAWSFRRVSRALVELFILSLYGVAVLITWPSAIGVAILLGTDIGMYSINRWLRQRAQRPPR
jgi:hypothetical protein